MSLLTLRRRGKIYFATLALLLRESARPYLRPFRHKSPLDKAFPSNSNLDCRYRNYNLELAWITAFSKLRNPLFPVCVDSNSYNHRHLLFSADCSSIPMPAPPPNSFQALRKSAMIPLLTTTNTRKFLNSAGTFADPWCSTCGRTSRTLRSCCLGPERCRQQTRPRYWSSTLDAPLLPI